MIGWIRTKIGGSKIGKKEWEVDGFRTKGDLLREEGRFRKREIARDREMVQE